jgi:hypothetical protein
MKANTQAKPGFVPNVPKGILVRINGGSLANAARPSALLLKRQEEAANIG